MFILLKLIALETLHLEFGCEPNLDTLDAIVYMTRVGLLVPLKRITLHIKNLFMKVEHLAQLMILFMEGNYLVSSGWKLESSRV